MARKEFDGYSGQPIPLEIKVAGLYNDSVRAVREIDLPQTIEVLCYKRSGEYCVGINISHGSREILDIADAVFSSRAKARAVMKKYQRIFETENALISIDDFGQARIKHHQLKKNVELKNRTVADVRRQALEHYGVVKKK